MENKFLDQIEIHESILKRLTPVFDIVGYIKIFLVAALAAAIYLALTKSPAYLPACLLIFAVLVALWVYHGRVHEKIKFSTGIIEINRKHLSRILGQWTDFADTGREFLEASHAYAADLDVVGKKSLFQFLGVNGTWHGRNAFARDLLSADYTTGRLLQRQQAVLELSEDLEFSNRMQYHLSRAGAEGKDKSLIDGLSDGREFIKSRALRLILTGLPLPVCLFAAGSFIFRQDNLYPAAVTLVFAQALFWIAGLPKTALYLNSVADIPRRLNLYATAIEGLSGRQFKSEKLTEIQNRLNGPGNSARAAMMELDRIAGMISARQNLIVYAVLNVFLMWDYECAFRLEGWRRKYAAHSRDWFMALGEFESLLSLSILPNVCGGTCLPVPEADRKIISAKGLGHPLIPSGVRVDNDLEFTDNIFIVSGSNMSGKTTFLRTVGLNLILARAGGFVCAGEMRFFPFSPRTSMRIVDDLNEGVSTFYAELKRIKSIIDSAKNGEDIIFLIDEIFKGTNSVDRMNGARAVISKLNGLGAAGLVTTHDLELCDLEALSPRIRNFSFSEYYEQDGANRCTKIKFDYKIKRGKSTTTNGKYLMEMVGIDTD